MIFTVTPSPCTGLALGLLRQPAPSAAAVAPNLPTRTSRAVPPRAQTKDSE